MVMGISNSFGATDWSDTGRDGLGVSQRTATATTTAFVPALNFSETGTLTKDLVGEPLKAFDAWGIWVLGSLGGAEQGNVTAPPRTEDSNVGKVIWGRHQTDEPQQGGSLLSIVLLA
jgi:hypothetical protein